MSMMKNGERKDARIVGAEQLDGARMGRIAIFNPQEMMRRAELGTERKAQIDAAVRDSLDQDIGTRGEAFVFFHKVQVNSAEEAYAIASLSQALLDEARKGNRDAAEYAGEMLEYLGASGALRWTASRLREIPETYDVAKALHRMADKAEKDVGPEFRNWRLG